ncbi:MAG: antitoxin [Candidatus Altiarchaeales archaeon HGW-Altiarchaeales-1]|nr:MAG: antitoxin [Candidatus Altiarchaeales archaeon HGW-Altiarchaeales-2]PKP60852.1 MAG: antitoxin [Candidatus Altiarchaeales archaeon HGW-Altiarchaeales-1]
MEDKIVVNPKILSGKPIIKGTRISVEFTLEMLSSGMSVDDITDEYPHLKREDVLAAIEYAAKSIKHEELIFLIEPNKLRVISSYDAPKIPG